MSMVVIRHATAEDAPGLTDLLNAIIRAGSTTAMEDPLDVAQFEDRFIRGKHCVVCHVAVAGEERLGFQQLSDFYPLPAGWVDIATFTRRQDPVRGVGTSLFACTRAWAARKGYSAINATIRADNQPGLAYYTKIGFHEYRIDPGVPLRDGRLVDRISRRFDLP